MTRMWSCTRGVSELLFSGPNTADDVEHLHALANSQLSGPTQKNRFGFKFSQKKKSKDAEREAQNMSVLCIEVFAKSRH